LVKCQKTKRSGTIVNASFRKRFSQHSKSHYVNYLGDDETGEPVAAAYGPNYRRLQKLKAKYDPENFFRMNQNIRPLA
jgi:FAD/FMN-containing dehydrogenase